MSLRYLVFCALAFLNVSGSAAEVVVTPDVLADRDGDTVTNISGVPEYRLQMVFAASQFEGLSPDNNMITRLDWRPDGGLEGPQSYGVESWKMELSSTTRQPGDMSLTFVENVGDGVTEVYNGPLTLETANIGPAGGPKAFDYGFDFTTPFAYDQSKNLLIDLTITGVDNPEVLSLDFEAAATGVTEFIWSGTNGVDSPDAVDTRFGGDATQFTFVPEPASLPLAIIGLFGLWTRQRRS